jgi:hypothetical protein
MKGFAEGKESAPMGRARPDRDLRQFLFTATGKNTDVGDLSMIDVYDNLILEAERLASLEGMLSSHSDSEIGTPHGLALLLGDIRRRMQMILELALARHEPMRRRTLRKK